MSDARFDACWPLTLREECPHPEDWSNPRNFSDDPGDPGGPTMCGIIQSEYNRYRALKGLAPQGVKLISQAEGADIYYNSYWLPHCPTLPAGLDLDFFDECVNTGAAEAIKVLQYALNLNVDGIWGPRTMAGVGALLAGPETKQAIKAYTYRREDVYRMFRGYGEFGKGWEARAARIGAAALAMVKGT